MPIRRADDLPLTPPPRCIVCGGQVTAQGPGQPIAEDEWGRLYCQHHGHWVDPDYDALLADYQRRRAAFDEFLQEAAAHGICPTQEEMDEIRREWNAPG